MKKKQKKTGFDRWFEEQMKDPEFKKYYLEAKKEFAKIREGNLKAAKRLGISLQEYEVKLQKKNK